MTLNEFWVWVCSALGAASARKLLRHYSDPLAACTAGRNEWVKNNIISEKEMERAMRITPEQAQRTVSECNEKHWHIILPGSEYYPRLLSQISDYPAILFVNGNPQLLSHKLMIASVGTRNFSAQGEHLAYSLSKSLSRAGVLVVSGGAMGIDSCSHSGALDGGTGTVAVLGCGFNCDYLAKNAALRRKISQNGALISEYMPDEKALPYHFPARNRIISGMCQGTVVTQAAEKSGSLITARCAKKQGRAVFAFPISSELQGFSGNSSLFADGAKPITCAYDVLRDFPEAAGIEKLNPFLRENLIVNMPSAEIIPEPQTAETEQTANVSKPAAPKQRKPKGEDEKEEKISLAVQKKQELPENLSEFAKRLYEQIDIQPIQSDVAAVRAGLKGSELLCALTELELAGVVRQLPGNRCVAC